MKSLSENGEYTVDDEVKDAISKNFVGYYADEKLTSEVLKKYYEEYNYLADTHTSVALACAEQYLKENADNNKIIVASTASPYKFAADVYKSITNKAATSDTAALDELSALTNTEITYPLRNLTDRKINFTTVINSEDMLKEVYKFM